MSDRHADDSSLSPSRFFRLEAVCKRFEDAWKGGRAPRIEDYLGTAQEADRSELLHELLLLDLDYRTRGGENPSPADYKARFPRDAKLVDDAFRQVAGAEAAKPRGAVVSGRSGSGGCRPDVLQGDPVEPDEASLEVVLEVIDGPHKGRTFKFTGHDSFVVGRASRAHFRLPRQDLYFSRYHFMVEVNPPCCRLVDLVSTNGTYINDRRVTAADLRDGDRIRGGDTVLRVSLLGAGGKTLPGPSGGTDTTRTFPPCAAPKPSREPAGRDPDEGRVARAADQGETPDEPLVIPGFRIVCELGRGGMGVVYLAERAADGVRLAVKAIRPVYTASDREVQRFLREAQILCTLRHPHIVAFHQMGRAGDLFYFVMDYVPGTDAGCLLERQGPLPVGRAVRLVCQILAALDFAHAHGFVHRDVKPANLLVGGSGPNEICRLADFGLARVYQNSRMSGLTVLGDMGGTLPYMPPEQITNYRQSRPPADQYSAAATLYHLLTGRYLYDFDAGGDEQKLMKILNEEPVPIHKRRAGIPEPLAKAIHRALAKDPGKRFPSAAAFQNALLLSTGGD